MVCLQLEGPRLLDHADDLVDVALSQGQGGKRSALVSCTNHLPTRHGALQTLDGDTRGARWRSRISLIMVQADTVFPLCLE